MINNGLTYVGNKGTLLRYDNTRHIWKATIRNNKKGRINATLFGNENMYAYGLNEWEITSKYKTVQAMLSMSTCNASEFTCSNGQCIPLLLRCNGVEECVSGSDEIDCTIVQFPPSYNAALAPLADQCLTDPAIVNVSVKTISVLNVDEDNNKIRGTVKKCSRFGRYGPQMGGGDSLPYHKFFFNCYFLFDTGGRQANLMYYRTQ